jgi:hypothetical protein
MNNTPEPPAAWQKKDHFHVRLVWLSRTQKPSLRAINEEIKQMMIQRGNVEAAQKFTGEFQGTPGWYNHGNIQLVMRNDRNEALAEINRTLKNTSFEWFEAAKAGLNKPPVHVSKSQRRELITRWRQALEQPPEPKDDDGWDNLIMLEIDPEYALVVALDASSFERSFAAAFKTKSNPLRSLIGLELIVEYFGPLETDWREIAQGTLEIKGRTLKVDGWSKEFEANEMVYGIATEEAWIYIASAKSAYRFFKPNHLPPDADLNHYLREDSDWIEED